MNQYSTRKCEIDMANENAILEYPTQTIFHHIAFGLALSHAQGFVLVPQGFVFGPSGFTLGLPSFFDTKLVSAT